MMEHPLTHHLHSNEAGLTQAAQLLRTGQLVAFPTETVYGLGGDATDGQAVARIYQAKGRPSFNPLIAHVPDLDAALSLVDLNDDGMKLAEAFWPGPLTIVGKLRKDTGISELVTAGLDTLAVRVPAHPMARNLLARVGRPVAAPSANPSGRISPTTAQHVMAGLTGRIAAVLDDGPCSVGLESTIIGAYGQHITLLRPGGLALEDISQITGNVLSRSDGDAITAPGQLVSHYAPVARVRLNAETIDANEILLGFGPVDGAELNLSPKGNLIEAAANLFAYLHEMDARAGQHTIAVAPIPQTGLGVAINDRLRRAAAPRA